MTCVTAVVQDGNVYMGGDSAGVNAQALTITVRNDEKVFFNGPFLIGGTTSFRMLQLLRYKFVPPAHPEGVDDMRYMVTDFIDSVRKCFTENGFGSASSGGNFLVGYNGKLYNIDGDYQVGIPALNYDAVGCGENFALGSFHATSKNKNAMQRVEMALEAASEFSAGVCAPFVLLKLMKPVTRSKKR